MRLFRTISLALLFLISTQLVKSQNCTNLPAWNPSAIYLGGDQVTFNGNKYKAKWWTQNETPNAVPTGVWQDLGSCTSTSTAGNCLGLSTWNAASAYNAGDEVILSNKKYAAQWWTQNQQPGTANAPWTFIADCQSPVISVSASLSAFTANVGTPSTAQTFTVSAANQTSDVLVSAPNGFQVSLTPGTGFGRTVVLIKSGSTVPLTTLYVQFNPSNTGSYSGNIAVSSTGSTTQQIAVSGNSNSYTKLVCNGVAAWSGSNVYNNGNEVVYNGNRFKAKWWNQNSAPSTTDEWGAWQIIGGCVYSSLTVSATSLTSFATLLGTPSAQQSFSLSAQELTSVINISAPSQFEVSLQAASGYTSYLTLNPDNNGNVATTTIYVRFNPYATGNIDGKVIVSTVGIDPKYVSVSGTGNATWITNANLLYTNSTITNVGIGTSSVPSGYLLGVNGKIISKGLKVQFQNWADVVFQKEYKLMPLSEVEKFVQQNKHLPEFPSENSALKDGVAIEDMNVLLLKKVEELTLYIIEQDKKIKALEEKVR